MEEYIESPSYRQVREFLENLGEKRQAQISKAIKGMDQSVLEASIALVDDKQSSGFKAKRGSADYSQQFTDFLHAEEKRYDGAPAELQRLYHAVAKAADEDAQTLLAWQRETPDNQLKKILQAIAGKSGQWEQEAYNRKHRHVLRLQSAGDGKAVLYSPDYPRVDREISEIELDGKRVTVEQLAQLMKNAPEVEPAKHSIISRILHGGPQPRGGREKT